MATRLPTIIADPRLDGGPVGPYASPQAFSGGAEGLDTLGQGMANLGGSLAEIAAKKQRDDDARWHSKAAAQYAEEAITFLNDPQNANREDYSSISLGFLKDQQTKYLQQAPSSRARQLFTQYADGFRVSNLPGILKHTEAVRLTNAKNEVETNVNKAMGAFRQQAAVDSVMAAHNAETLRQLYHTSLRDMYANIAPNAEKGLREYIDEQFVIGTSEKNPAYARRILDQSEYIDPSRRKALLDSIERTESSTMAVAQLQFAAARQKQIDAASRNNELVPPISKNTFIKVYGAERGEIEHVKDELQIEGVNTAAVFISGIQDKNAASILSEVSKASQDKSVSGPAFSRIREQASALVKHQAEDPGGYFVIHNSEISRAWRDYESAPPEMQAQKFKEYTNLQRTFQGRPPAGAKDPNRYLGLAKGDQHLLPKVMAESWAAQMNKGDLTQQNGALMQFAALFEDNDSFAMGFNDLMTLPTHGVKPELKLALQFANFKDGQVFWDSPEKVRAYLGSIASAEALKEIGKKGQKYSDFEAELSTNKDWLDFKNVMLGGDDQQFAGDLAAYKRGIIAYAFANSEVASDGVTMAVKDLINSHHYFTSINGQPFGFSRKRKDGTVRSEIELEDITRRLGVSLNYLNVDAMDKERLWFIPRGAADNSRETRMATIKYLISNGFFRPEPDGNGATLYVKSDAAIATQITDKQGNPFRIHFDNLPSFMLQREVPAGVGFRGMTSGATRTEPAPVKPGELEERVYPAWFDDDKTNWPVRDWTISDKEWSEFRDAFRKMMQNVPPQRPTLFPFEYYPGP